MTRVSTKRPSFLGLCHPLIMGFWPDASNRSNKAGSCPNAVTHRRFTMPKQARKQDYGGRPSSRKRNPPGSQPEEVSAKQRKQHAHNAPVRRAASKVRE